MMMLSLERTHETADEEVFVVQAARMMKVELEDAK
jgi:hypothetical protein